jgi:hypothetical protein
MVIITGHGRADARAVVLTPYIERAQSLLADLRRFAIGHLPTARELADAPTLDGWATALRPVPCLVGLCTNHPDPLVRGPVIRTSPLWALAPELGWARTEARVYRLGEPALPDNRAAAHSGRGLAH